MSETIIQKLKLTTNNNEFYVKRDDLLPFCFGGNKARIAKTFLEDFKKKRSDVMIGYGNIRSNLSRAISCMCSAYNIPCIIISPDDNTLCNKSSNMDIVSLTNTKIVKCDKSNVKETVKKILVQIESNGKKPYYIYGNELGVGNETVPIDAYFTVYNEIIDQSQRMSCDFDYIFCACGTGMTLSGLVCGKLVSLHEKKPNIVGISIARKSENEIPKILNMTSAFLNERGIAFNNCSIGESFVFTDEYLCGAYGTYDDDIVRTIREEITVDGIPLDTTYSGKAFNGMKKYIIDNKIKNKKILFVHTGGTPLFFDYLHNNCQSDVIYECNQHEKILHFLLDVDSLLPTPLSTRVNISTYTKKILSNGTALVIQDNGKIVSAVMFYDNNHVEDRAYITLIATLQSYEGRGYGSLLLNKACEIAKSNGMYSIELETENSNIHAIKFYQKNGFKIKKIDKKTHMEKDLR